MDRISRGAIEAVEFCSVFMRGHLGLDGRPSPDDIRTRIGLEKKRVNLMIGVSLDRKLIGSSALRGNS